MSSINEAREAIYSRFNTEWAARTEFTFDNERFDAPVNGSWVRLVVRNIVSNQETLGRMGNRKFNRQGSIICQVFVDSNTGLQNSDTLTEAIRTIFEGVSFNGVYANDCVIREIGPDGKWFQTNVETFFFYDDIK